jgi:cytochrome c
MHSLKRIDTLTLVAFALLALTLWSCSAPPSATPSPTAPPPVPTRTPISTHQWILVDVPSNASQVQYGAEVYRLVCQDCHGDRGQGLTAEWWQTWAPADQNCWQAKCHSESHPPDGFVLPVAPPVVGRAVLNHFATANDLYELIQNEMPWYRPGSLTERDAWSVTAYVLKMNQIDPGPVLDAAAASRILLR